ncbi:MAG: hypothetical protein ACOC5M_00710 [Chloroflexota bacterium]
MGDPLSSQVVSDRTLRALVDLPLEEKRWSTSPSYRGLEGLAANHDADRGKPVTDSSGSRRSSTRRRGSQILAIVAVGLILPLALVGCGRQSAVSGDKYTIYVYERFLPAGGGMEGIIQGTLATRNGCVVLEGTDDFIPVIWPAGTSIASEDPLTLELPSGEELTVGQTVRGGGGGADASSPTVKVDIPAECLSERGRVAVFNYSTDLSVVE